jgi:hypothetical protein
LIVDAAQQRHGKRLKPFLLLPGIGTRLKPGVNEIKIELQEIEIRPINT